MIKEKPLITVITLSYYSPDLLSCINSVLMQAYPQIQYIIIDDGTENFDKETIERHVEKNQQGNIKELVIIKNEQNQGIVRAFNIGLKLSKGEIIFNVAGDDQFADKEVLEDWVQAFKASNALIMTAYRSVYNEDQNKNIGLAPLRSEVKLIKKCETTKLFEKLAAKNFILGCCTAQTKESYEIYGLRDEKYRLIDDHPYYLNLLRKGQKIKFFDRVVINYRQGGVSYSTNIDKIYYKDADAIIKNEGLPYSTNPKKMQKMYNNWKKDVEFGARLATHRENERKCGNNKIKVFFLRVGFGLKNLKKVMARIWKLIRREYVKELKTKANK